MKTKVLLSKEVRETSRNNKSLEKYLITFWTLQIHLSTLKVLPWKTKRMIFDICLRCQLQIRDSGTIGRDITRQDETVPCWGRPFALVLHQQIVHHFEIFSSTLLHYCLSLFLQILSFFHFPYGLYQAIPVPPSQPLPRRISLIPLNAR